ncbi:MAG: DNA topoisomerase I [Actinomycetota bacterium]|nr:DNA topoisomerase I [Actinomycetota bacterium]
MSRLIVCEKNIAARRIAHILSEGRAKLEMIHNVPVYVFSYGSEGHDREEQVKCIGLKGHILKVDFPAQYNNWQEIDPIKLIDAPIVKVPTQKSILKALQKVAKDADVAVISTDFDREGELIGIDAVNKIREVNPNIKVKRARFSSLTESEIKRAFSNLEDVYMSLAQAGEARQDIDLIWGATLTRFLSLASSRLGRQFLSVGRVQSPTLSLVADREKKRQEHKPKPYWLVKALFESHGSEQFIALHKIERFWDKLEAEAVLSRLGKMGKVVDISTVRKVLKPPTPFNTTAFLSAAASIGVSPSRAMRIAENLYMEGLISYPRVDNTVYPPSLNFDEILKILGGSPELGNLANLILRQEKIIPTRGKTEATDHPPIHPTGLAKKEDLKAQEWKIYELVCRRFFGTLAPEASLQSVRIDIESGGEHLNVRGTVVVNEGWLEFYPYGRKKDEEVPTLKKGDELKLVKPILEEKETQPPPRYTQGQLIQKMEALGLGTKCLTGDTSIKIVRDQGIENVKLETLFSSCKYLGEIQYEDERIEVAENNGYKCFSFNGNEIIESEFYGVSRRRLREDEKVYEIFFEDGSSLKATDRHLICAYDGRKLTYVPCCALASGSLVISDTPFIRTRLYGRDCDAKLSTPLIEKEIMKSLENRMLEGKIIGWNVVTKKVKFIRKVTYNGYIYDILNVNNFSNFVLSNNVVVHNSTRHEIIKNLYDRSYIHGDPIVPTEMGLAVAEALRRHAGTISTPQMTAELEKDMDAIAEGKVARESVVDRSRNILARTMLDLGRKKEALAGEIREGIREDKIIGKCPRCGMDLKIIRAKKSKKRFIGCTGYPECNMAYPLPQYGEIITLDDVCEVCHSPKIKVIGRPPTSRGGKSPKPWILCIDPNCPTKKGSD